MIHQPVSVVSQCSLNALLSGWLAEISADLREAVVHYRRFVTMRCTNPRIFYFLLFYHCQTRSAAVCHFAQHTAAAAIIQAAAACTDTA